MPLTVLHGPSTDLVRQGGRLTDSGNIIVSRLVPFNLVKEAWFCVPNDNDRRSFDLIAKVMDERLEDELVFFGFPPISYPPRLQEGTDTGSHHEPAMRHADWTPLRREGKVAVCPCGLS